MALSLRTLPVSQKHPKEQPVRKDFFEKEGEKLPESKVQQLIEDMKKKINMNYLLSLPFNNLKIFCYLHDTMELQNVSR